MPNKPRQEVAQDRMSAMLPSPAPPQAEPKLQCVLNHANDPDILAEGGLVGSVKGQSVRFTAHDKSWTLLTGASSITIAFNFNGPIIPLTFELSARNEDATTGQLDVLLNPSGQTRHQSRLDVSGTDYTTYKVALPVGSLQQHNILMVSLGLVRPASMTALAWTPPRKLCP